MPHHAVVCESSSTTKIRAVFSASAPSRNKKKVAQRFFEQRTVIAKRFDRTFTQV